MLRLLRWIVYLIVLIAVFIVGGSFFLPSEAVVTRSAEIAAPPEKVFALVGDLRQLQRYSPWAELDANTRYSFEGADSGVGQTMRWAADNPQVGNGVQTITAYDPPRHVASQVDFGSMGTALATWDLAPGTTGTTATWGFRSQLDGIPAKWFGLMFDRWIGADYERGLARLKAASEAP